MNISAKSEYSRLVSASLNIPDRSYCVQRDSEGERATDKRKMHQIFLWETCFLPWTALFLLLQGLFFTSSGLPGPRAGVSLLQRLCPISIFMINGEGREGGTCALKRPEYPPQSPLMYNLNPPLRSTAPLTSVNLYAVMKKTHWLWNILSLISLFSDTLPVY